MYRFALPALAGLTIPALLPELPPFWLAALLLPFALMARHFVPAVAPALLGFALGLGVSLWHGEQLLDELLPAHLAGRDLPITGVVVSEVENDGRRARFLFAPERPDLPEKIQLSWYGAPPWLRGSGQQLALTARLKVPRSFVNPAGFDYRLWQLRRGVGALGYVREDDQNRLLQEAAPGGVRAHLRGWLRDSGADNTDVLRALLLGERDDLSDERWELFRQTGTSHLIAISGLHIGLAAGLGYLLGAMLERLLVLAIALPVHSVAIFMGAAAGGIYSALAGFSLPTQRALAMLLLFYAARLCGRQIGGLQVVLAAMLAVLALAPLSVYDAGFWLSFSAVSALILTLGSTRQIAPAPLAARLWRPQWVVFVALLVPLALFFGQWSWVSPVANVLAIALVSLWVVPLLFAGALTSFVWPQVSRVFLWLADSGLDGLWLWLRALVAAVEYLGPGPSLGASLSSGAGWLLTLGCVLWLMPAALRWRPLALLSVLVALWLPPRPPPPLSLTAMDVGQGLALVVRSGEQTLVYDTGPWFGPSFNGGEDIVAPYLKQLGVETVEALVVSHGHSDHAGGAPGLLKALPVEHFYSGEPIKYLESADARRRRDCRGSEGFALGEATVQFVPLPGQTGARGNNASCVLLLSWGRVQLLLPGDIERELEPALARQVGPVDVVVAPHHGSRSSSSRVLVQALNPGQVIFSAGFNNRHGHPHPQVVERYRRAGSTLHNTARHGAIRLRWNRAGELTVERWRQKERRYWRP